VNISVRRLEANDGSGLEERPEYVADALEADRVVGYREQKPLVPHPDCADDGLQYGDDTTEAYSHYKRGESLLLPESGDFLRELMDRVESVADAAEETNTDTATIRKACRLHGLQPPEASGDDVTEDGDDSLVLPSGESVPFDPLHPLTLAQLLSDGFSCSEAAQYLSREGSERVSEADVREAAREHSLLSGGSGDRDVRSPPSERTTAGGPPYDTTPWD